MTTAIEEWTEATYSISWYQGGQVVPHEATGLTWGSWGIDERDPGCWWVTHLPTGHSVGVFFALAGAQGYAHEIDPLMDWAALREPDELPTRVRTRARKARTKWGGR